MEPVTLSMYSVAFWGSIFFIVVGAILGLMGVWFENFWKNDMSAKLLMTDAIFLVTSVAVAVITKWLG